MVIIVEINECTKTRRSWVQKVTSHSVTLARSKTICRQTVKFMLITSVSFY